MRTLPVVMSIMLLSSVAFSQPRTLVVPTDHPSLNAAMAAARPGDTILLKPGTYKESAVVNKALTIQGEVPGQVIFSVPANSGRVISVETKEPVRIENLVLEHTDHAAFDQRKKDRSALLAVDGGSVEVRRCIFRDGITSGLAFTKETNGIAEDCKAERNREAGFLVRGGGAAKLIRCEANENWKSGIAVCERSGAEIVGAITRKNGVAGIQGFPVGQAPLIVRDCRAEENKSSGIYLTGTEAGTVEGNSSAKNGRYGIELTNKTQATVRKNTCTGNAFGGIHAAAILTDVVLEENTLTENRYSGILVEYAAKARITGNTVSKNQDSGIIVRCMETRAEIARNICDENAVFGIVVYMGSSGTAGNNQCRKNGSHGLGVLDPETDLAVGDNVLEENRTGQTFICKDRWPSSTTQIDGYYAGWGLAQRQYDYLEKLATWAGLQKDDLVSMSRFVEGTTKGYFPENCEAQQQYMPKVNEWAEKYPKSMAARNTVANALIEYAWHLRGGGFANTVTEAGGKGFKEYLGKAEQVLEEIEKEGMSDAITYRLWIYAGTGLGYPESRIRSLLKKGCDLCPTDVQLYWQVANYLLPRWHGEPGQLASFFEETYELTKGSKDARIYAEVVALCLFDFSHTDIMSGAVADWDRVKKGLEQHLNDVPENPYYLNLYCYAACRFEKRECAAKLFEKPGDRYDYMVWCMHNGKQKEEELFKRCRRWAKFENAPYPFADEFPSLEDKVEPKAAGWIASRIEMLSLLLLAVFAGPAMIAIRRKQNRYRKHREDANSEPPSRPPSDNDIPPVA